MSDITILPGSDLVSYLLDNPITMFNARIESGMYYTPHSIPVMCIMNHPRMKQYSEYFSGFGECAYLTGLVRHYKVLHKTSLYNVIHRHTLSYNMECRHNGIFCLSINDILRLSWTTATVNDAIEQSKFIKLLPSDVLDVTVFYVVRAGG